MIYALIAESIALITLVALLWAVERSNSLERSDRAQAYERTLQSMADRIQAPERVPLSSLQSFPTPDPEVDEMAQVGTITIDENYGTEDE